MTPKPTDEGVVWYDHGFQIKARWKTEPAITTIKSICARVLNLNLGSSDECVITYLTAGALNKTYLVEVNGTQKYIFRATLPVDPHYKTAGEVATLRWLRQLTTIPVPEVFAFYDGCDTEPGFEWILMEFMPGSSAHESWRKLSMTAKTTLVHQLAEYQLQLFKIGQNGIGFRGIGTLSEQSTEDGNLVLALGPVVSPEFFIGNRHKYPIPRGPFSSSFFWLDSFIKIIIQEQTSKAENTEDTKEKEDAMYTQKTAERLASLLPKLIASIQSPPERTILWHDDLSLSNILVNEEGDITAIIGWEFASTKPFWVATGLPEALLNSTRDTCPIRDMYEEESPEEREARAVDGDFTDNEGKSGLYWNHLMEYEQTLLRTVYSDHMNDIWPTWEAEVADGALRIDFLDAVRRCFYQWGLQRVEMWIDELERGNFIRLD